jgi:excisionase family DNA binding protein
METQKLLSPAQAAKLLGCHSKTVTTWALAGHIPYGRTPSGYFKFKEEDIQRLARQQRGEA